MLKKRGQNKMDNSMQQLTDLIKDTIQEIGLHVDIYYSKIMDWCIKIYRQNMDGADITIFDKQHPDIDMLASKAYAALKGYMKERTKHD